MSSVLTRILCIDDDEDILQVTQMTLEAIGGFDVVCCGSGMEALERVAAIGPDLILLDAMMPEMDGPSTFGELRALPEASRIPVIFLTARVQQEEIEQYLKLGAIGVLQKPFDPMQLADQVRQLWNQAHPNA